MVSIIRVRAALFENDRDLEQSTQALVPENMNNLSYYEEEEHVSTYLESDISHINAGSYHKISHHNTYTNTPTDTHTAIHTHTATNTHSDTHTGTHIDTDIEAPTLNTLQYTPPFKLLHIHTTTPSLPI